MQGKMNTILNFEPDHWCYLSSYLWLSLPPLFSGLGLRHPEEAAVTPLSSCHPISLTCVSVVSDTVWPRVSSSPKIQSDFAFVFWGVQKCSEDVIGTQAIQNVPLSWDNLLCSTMVHSWWDNNSWQESSYLEESSGLQKGFLMETESIVRTLKIKQNHQNLAKKKKNQIFSPCLKRQKSRKEVHPSVPYFGDLKGWFKVSEIDEIIIIMVETHLNLFLFRLWKSQAKALKIL